ncbi:MAG: hypothetical protein CYPHOPRED_003651 [Cyphobasidiales sp. Tagirdzhanova-0007]|nr:MAG: hypothetical protein CYPHOPRED_003651 [Cyphobasidiales sp. Tagirdzhanova-0007]
MGRLSTDFHIPDGLVMSKWMGRSKKRPAERGGGLASNPNVLYGAPNPSVSASISHVTLPGRPELSRASSILSEAIDDVEFNHNIDHSGAVTQTKKRKVNPRLPKDISAKGKSKAKTPPLSANFVSSVEWPEHFKKLQKTFRALNTVYTFLSTRKHLASTFDNLKSSVQTILKRPLEIHDIAQIKSLLPNLIRFAYIDRELLQVHAMGDDSEKARKKQERDQMFMLNDLTSQDSTADPSTSQSGNEQVLVFEFNDGELKGKGGKVITKRFAKKKAEGQDPEKVKPVATFTTKSMTNLVERRNTKFDDAVDELLVSCAAQDEDPVKLLLSATDDHVPVNNPDGSPAVTPLTERWADLDFFLRNPENRPSVESIINEMIEREDYQNQIVDGGRRTISDREARFGELDDPLSPAIMDALYETKKAKKLYSHQAEAINYLSAGKSVIVSTSTSSGKSLIYQIPALKAFERDSEATAIYIYPTKALAQDQKRGLSELLACCDNLDHVKIATFDGDTPREDRDYIREHANVIFTNPDMLHVTLLPNEESWRRMFRNLKLVVVDELHMYNGLFGSHVAFVMRRLRRICAAVGNEGVVFVSCSATIENPAAHMKAIFGVEQVEVVAEDGSPCGQKEWLVWNPPWIDPMDVTQGRISSISEASRIFRFLMDRGIRTIMFCKVRKSCELLIRQVRMDLMLEGRSDMASRVMSYRSGYNAQDRRRIEQEMFRGHLLGIIATTALELGIDIGSLDAVITVGFPYTLPGLRQQAGRAGRRNKDSLAMLICDPFPVDQHYAKHPHEIFTNPYAELDVDLTNSFILEAHLQCAANELPVHPKDDIPFFGSDLAQICNERLVVDDEGFYLPHYRYRPNPSKHVSIRTTDDETYTVIDITDGKYKVLEEIEWARAIFELFEGAIFMHQGQSFLVKELSHDQRLGKLEQTNVEWTTRQRDYTDIDAIEALRIREIANAPLPAYYGRVQIKSIVFGYFKVGRRNNILDVVDLETPPFMRESNGLWLDLPSYTLEILRSKNIHIAGAIHAAEHALLNFVSSAGDVRTECKPAEKEFAATKSTRKRPARITLYDAAGQSGGICAKAFDRIGTLLMQAADRVIGCGCSDGCPRCIASSMCSQANIVTSKLGAMIVLQILTGRGIDLDAIPVQEELSGVTPSDTIISVQPVRAGPNVLVLSSDGTPLSPEQKQTSRFANFYHGMLDEENDMQEPVQRAFTASVPAERGGFLRIQNVDTLEAQRYAVAQDINLETLSSLLEEQRKVQARLSEELEASNSSLDTLLKETKISLNDLKKRTTATRTSYLQLEEDLLDHRDLLLSPVASGAQRSATLMETLQSYHARIKDLERARLAFSYLAKAEELHLISQEQLKLPSSKPATETYCELVKFARDMYKLAPPASDLAINPFIRGICSETWHSLYKALQSKCLSTLDALEWPSKKIQGFQLDLMSQEKAKAFKSAFLELLMLQKIGTNNPLPAGSTLDVEAEEACCLPVVTLAQPLILRFRYHFDGKRQTNRLDKPEWYFAHILNALSDHEQFVRGDIQKLLKEGGEGNVEAMIDFITVLLRPLTRKIRSSVPQLLELPSILSHTIYQALQFDSTIRDSFAYSPGQTRHNGKRQQEWKGTANVILGNPAWFNGWKAADKKFVDDKYFEIISSAEAFHINEDYAPSTSSVLRPTNSALRIRDLFDQVTDRYRPLPDFSLQLPFLVDVQLPLFEAYLQRISSATDAFETLSFGLMRAVPGSLAGGDSGSGGSSLTNGLNGLQRLIRAAISAWWMESVLKEWSEDVFFLDLWQSVREQSIENAETAVVCRKLINRSPNQGVDSGLFDPFIENFHALARRIEQLIVKHVVKEVSGELKSYLSKRWDDSFESSASDEISPDLVSALTVFSTLLSQLSTALTPLGLNGLYRSITAPIQEMLITRSVLPKIWSENGGQQFLLDVQSGWLTAAKGSLSGKVRRPENGLSRLLAAARLVSLPANASSPFGDRLTIWKVVQVTWDDTNDAAYFETLDKIGIKDELKRDEVKAIIRKRPECWG